LVWALFTVDIPWTSLRCGDFLKPYTMTWQRETAAVNLGGSNFESLDQVRL
jgi:hypothetical protein